MSMSANSNFYVWEGDSTNVGLRNVFLRNNTASPVTTTALAPTVNSTQPSISNNGRYIALMRRASTTNYYQAYTYDRTTNVYTLRLQSASLIEHPSVSNALEKIAWFQQVSATSNRIYVRDLVAAVSTLVVNTTSVLAHPHLSADGNYLAYAQEVTDRFVVYTRNLTTNQQIVPVSTTASLTAPYWQFPVPVTQLAGSATGPATSAIPNLEFVARGQDYSKNHPRLANYYVSHNTLLLVFKLNTTVQQANAVINAIGGEMVGGLRGVAGQSMGVIAVRLPTTTHQAMIDTVTSLNAKPEVEVAVQDSLLAPNAISQASASLPTQWTWENVPATGNYGMELIRAPQLWNLNESLKKSSFRAPTGVIDAGFAANHPDLVDILRNHGTANRVGLNGHK